MLEKSQAETVWDSTPYVSSDALLAWILDLSQWFPFLCLCLCYLMRPTLGGGGGGWLEGTFCILEARYVCQRAWSRGCPLVSYNLQMLELVCVRKSIRGAGIICEALFSVDSSKALLPLPVEFMFSVFCSLLRRSWPFYLVGSCIRVQDEQSSTGSPGRTFHIRTHSVTIPSSEILKPRAGLTTPS